MIAKLVVRTDSRRTFAIPVEVIRVMPTAPGMPPDMAGVQVRLDGAIVAVEVRDLLSKDGGPFTWSEREAP